jgi:hypothetical protein
MKFDLGERALDEKLRSLEAPHTHYKPVSSRFS